VRIDKIHSRLHADGASITHDRRTLRLRRRSPGAATERQQTVGGRRPPGRNGQISVPVSSAGARCWLTDIITRICRLHNMIMYGQILINSLFYISQIRIPQ